MKQFTHRHTQPTEVVTILQLMFKKTFHYVVTRSHFSGHQQVSPMCDKLLIHQKNNL